MNETAGMVAEIQCKLGILSPLLVIKAQFPKKPECVMPFKLHYTY